MICLRDVFSLNTYSNSHIFVNKVALSAQFLTSDSKLSTPTDPVFQVQLHYAFASLKDRLISQITYEDFCLIL